MQGVAEFLPISSSGHLVILQVLFGMKEPQVLLDVMLHIGTLAAILVVFRRDIYELALAAARIAKCRRIGDTAAERMLIALVAGSIPTAIIGILFKDQFERLFSSMIAAGVGLLITGCLLALTAWTAREAAVRTTDGSGGVGLRQAFIIGISQGVAIVPGISRSGSTIATALLLGVPRETAASFSFLLSVPAVGGALLLELKDYASAGTHASMPAAVLGAVVAAGVGIAALLLLLKIVKQGKISYFAYYCWFIGIFAIAVGILKR